MSKKLSNYIPAYKAGAVFDMPSVFTNTVNFQGAVTQKAGVISGVGATRTLLATESGSAVLFDRAAGVTYTLPTPAVGLYFDFLVSVSVTSNGHKVITNAGSVFLAGTLTDVDTDSSNAVAAFTGDGATHVSINMTATGTNAKGGLIGTAFRLTCVTSTLWIAQGFVQAAGSPTTPFATS